MKYQKLSFFFAGLLITSAANSAFFKKPEAAVAPAAVAPAAVAPAAVAPAAVAPAAVAPAAVKPKAALKPIVVTTSKEVKSFSTAESKLVPNKLSTQEDFKKNDLDELNIAILKNISALFKK